MKAGEAAGLDGKMRSRRDDLRPATMADLGDLVRLASVCAGAACWSRAVWERTLASAEAELGSRLIAVSEGENGLLGIVVVHNVVAVAELENLAVHPRARRCGAGTLLMREAVVWAEARGARSLELEVRSGNLGALELYRALGFVEVARRTGYYAAPVEDAVLMSRSF